MLAANFTVQEVSHVQAVIDLSKLGHNGIFHSIYNILRYPGYGIHSTDQIRSEIVTILAGKNIPASITLKELYDLTGKELVVVTSNLNREKGCYLHHAQYPNVALLDAMMCSIGVPILLRTKQHDFMGTNDYYVDGGLVDNYPLWVFNELDALYDGTLFSVERDRIPSVTLGLKLLVPGTNNSYEVTIGRREIDSLSSYLIQILNTMMAQIDRSFVSASYIHQTIPIFIDSISFLKFDLDKAEIEKLIQIGKDSVSDYFNKKSLIISDPDQ